MQQARGESNTNPITLLKDDKKFSASMYPRISKPQTGSETRQPTDSAKDPVALSPDKKKRSASMHSDLSKLRTGSGSIQPRDSALSLFSGNSTSASKSFTTPTSHGEHSFILYFLAQLAKGQQAYVMALCPLCMRLSVHVSVRHSFNLFFQA